MSDEKNTIEIIITNTTMISAGPLSWIAVPNTLNQPMCRPILNTRKMRVRRTTRKTAEPGIFWGSE